MRSILVIFLLLITASISISAQENVATATAVRKDTTQIKETNSKKSKKVRIKNADFVPVPKKALLYSLIIPAGGQVYNRKYWKVPLVLGAYGGLVYAFDFNGRQYRRFRTAFEYRVDGIDATSADELVPSGITDAQIKRVRDSARKNLELTYMAAVIVHALSGIEAYVDAHLRNFDISEDLSFSLKPTYESGGLVGAQTGVGLFITF